MYNDDMVISIDQTGRFEQIWLLEAVLECSEYELADRLSQKAAVISVVGGGGKTTCIKAMASECHQKELKAVITTTTHMQMPHDQFLLDAEDMDAFFKKMEEAGQVWLGKRLDPNAQDPNMVRNKSRALSFEFVRKVCRSGGFPVFIEADGAKRLPCKVPADHEPVIVPETTIVLNVYGMDTLGKTFEETVFRYEKACAILGKKPADTVTEDDLIRLAMSSEGGMKGVVGQMDYQVVLNKADTVQQVESAAYIAKHLIESGASRVHITSGLKELMRP